MSLARLAMFVLTPVAAVIAAVISLLVTESGTRALLAGVAAAADIELEHGSGVLLGDLELQLVRYADEDMVVTLEGLRARLDRTCLGRGDVCLPGASVRNVDVEVLFPEEEIEEEEDTGPLLDLPFQVFGEGLTLDQLRVHWDGGVLTGHTISGDAAIVGERITVTGATGHGARLYVPDDGTESDDAELPEVDLPFELVVERAILRDSQWDIYDVRNHYDELEVSGHWQGTRMRVTAGRILNVEWGQVDLSGELVFEHPYGLGADSNFQVASPPLWEGLHRTSGTLELRGDLSALEIAGELCGGTLPLTMIGKIDLITPEWPLSLQADGRCRESQAAVPLAALPGLEDVADWSLVGGWQVSLSGDPERQRIELRAELTEGGYGPVAIALDADHYAGRVDIGELVVSRLSGEQNLQASGEFIYAEDYRWDLLLALEDLELPPQLQPVAGQLAGQLRSSGELRGDLWWVELADMAVSGVINELPADISGRLRVDQDLDFDGSDLDARGNGLSLRLVDKADVMPRAELSLDDLGAWLEGGQGRLQANIYWQRDTASIAFNGLSAGLRWPGGSLDRFEVDGRYDYQEHDQDVALRIRGAGASLGDVVLDALDAELSGTAAEHRLNLSLSGDVATALQLDGGLQQDDWRGRLQPATISLGESVWTLATAVDLAFDSAAQQLTPSAHCWQERGVELCFEKLTIGEAGLAGIDLSGDLVRAAGLLPERFSLNGPVSARVDAEWEELELQQLAARLEVGAGELRENLLGGDWTDFNWDYLKFAYRGDRDAGRLQGSMVEGGQERLAVDVNMPSARDGPLSGQLVLKDVELQSFENFVDALSQLRGEIGGTLEFSGRVDAPQIDGSLALRDGRAALARSPTAIEDLALEMRFRGSRAELLGQLSLGGGNSQLRGELDWREQPYLQLAMQGGEKRLSIPPKSEVTVAEDLLLDLSAEKISLTGDVVIPQGKLELLELSEGAVEVSDDVLLFDGEGNPLQDTSSAPVGIDVNVRIPDQLRVSTEGIAGRLGGQLQVVQAPLKPLQLLGRLRIVDGQFDLLGPRFQVTRGQLSFVGVPDNPQLDIAMERQITEDQVTVGIRVGGNLELPRLEFYSRPALPEEEVMAYVFGGRKIDRTGDTDSLAMALAMTSGLMQSQGILKGVSLGVEGRDSKARAAIGGYVSDRIYMSYGIGLYTPINTLTVRMDILRNFWLEVVSGLDNSADVYYAWKI